MGNQNGRESGERYRLGYPDHEEDDPHASDNLAFYQGKLRCQPNGLLVDELLESWWDLSANGIGKYDTLELEHGYIQWLFPIREQGMNPEAQPLMLHEREAIRDDPECKGRLIRSYRLFLDFLGIAIIDESTGALARAPHYRERFENLVTHGHNFLRITRVLKCLGELGYSHYQPPLVYFLYHETYETKLLQQCANSLAEFWIHVVINDETREELIKLCDSQSDAEIGSDRTIDPPAVGLPSSLNLTEHDSAEE